MAFTEFCCRSGGSNLNSGTRTGSSTEPGTAADFTYTSGTWVNATLTFTRLDAGSFVTDGIIANTDIGSVYPDAATVTPFIALITTVTATTLVFSSTKKSGTAPIDGVANTSVKIGGAFKGPNAAVGFPFTLIAGTLTNNAGDPPRVNLKNDASYSVTAAIAQSGNGPLVYQGYTSSYGDLGRAIIDGGTTGASYILLSYSGNQTAHIDIIGQNNGATGNAVGVKGTNSRQYFIRSVVNSIRGSGFQHTGGISAHIECEAYLCNQNNSAGLGGFDSQSNRLLYLRCIAHNNSGSNNLGFVSSNTAYYKHCISETNGLHGLSFTAAGDELFVDGCDFYNNGGSGISTAATTNYIENSNFVKNTAWGFTASAAGIHILNNNAYGAGTQANGSGTSNGNAIIEAGAVTYANDATPWADPANGDFRISLGAAVNAGRGTFTETQGGYAGTVGYPDIGAAQRRCANNPLRGRL